MITIKDKSLNVTFTGTYESTVIDGSYQVKDAGTLTNINGTVLTPEGEYIGNFDVYSGTEDFTINKHNVKLANIEIVDAAVLQCIADVKALLTE